MSWSVSAQGKPKAVAAKLALDFTRINCSEPEQTIKNKVAEAVEVALAAFPPNMPVAVVASGSQGCPDSSKAPEEKYNQVSFKIDPIYTWVE